MPGGSTAAAVYAHQSAGVNPTFKSLCYIQSVLWTEREQNPIKRSIGCMKRSQTFCERDSQKFGSGLVFAGKPDLSVLSVLSVLGG
jgi:hypothetical protein